MVTVDSVTVDSMAPFEREIEHSRSPIIVAEVIPIELLGDKKPLEERIAVFHRFFKGIRDSDSISGSYRELKAGNENSVFNGKYQNGDGVSVEYDVKPMKFGDGQDYQRAVLAIAGNPRVYSRNFLNDAKSVLAYALKHGILAKTRGEPSVDFKMGNRTLSSGLDFTDPFIGRGTIKEHFEAHVADGSYRIVANQFDLSK